MSSSSSNEEERDVVVTDDVLFEIFSFLTADTLIRFRIICKSWFNLITSSIRNPRFVEMHTHHHHHPSNATTITSTTLPIILCTSTGTQPIPYHHLYSLSSSSSLSCKKKKKMEAMEIVYPFKSPSSKVNILGSCNGLLCIKVTDYNNSFSTSTLCLWNSTTNEFKQVPAPPIQKPGQNVIILAYGFGFDRFIEDYKLVKLIGFTDESIEIKVYTLGTNSWKRIRVFENKIPYGIRQAGLYVHGALHWIGGDYYKQNIHSFNLQDEEFREVPKPECSKKMMFRAGLQVLRGCLCIFNSYVDPNRVFEVWMMMHYGVKESWTKLFSVNINLEWTRTGPWENLKPLWIFNNGKVLIGSSGVQCSSRHLVIYDPNNNEIIESIGVQGIPLNRTREMVHIRSLVSLKSGTYVDQELSKKKEIKHKRREIIYKPSKMSLDGGYTTIVIRIISIYRYCLFISLVVVCILSGAR